MRKDSYLHFLLTYPLNTAPSQRFRFEQFFPYLEQCNFRYNVNCFYDEKSFSILYKKQSSFKLGLNLVKCFFRRCLHMFTLGKYDIILIQRGACPFGPPIFEWIIRYIYGKPIIYDFDDSIWREPTDGVPLLKRLIKSNHKVPKICKWAAIVVTGNQYLANFARQFNINVIVIPTVVDTDKRFFPISNKINETITIGWTGSHTTLPYLEELEPMLLALQEKNRFTLMVMANKPPEFKKLTCDFILWTEEAEVEELRKIDIGIMPLPDNEWTKGKCGFKAIQYMALGKPTVASDVGVNGEIIEHGINGYLCKSHEDWQKYLNILINDQALINKQGAQARKKIEEGYSLKRAVQEWCKVIENV